jgi:hypothetical protein
VRIAHPTLAVDDRDKVTHGPVSELFDIVGRVGVKLAQRFEPVAGELAVGKTRGIAKELGAVVDSAVAVAIPD